MSANAVPATGSASSPAIGPIAATIRQVGSWRAEVDEEICQMKVLVARLMAKRGARRKAG